MARGVVVVVVRGLGVVVALSAEGEVGCGGALGLVVVVALAGEEEGGCF